MLGQIRQHQPDLTARVQVIARSRQKPSEHLAVLVIDRVIERADRPGRNPRWIANDHIRPSGRKQVRTHYVDRQPKPRHVVPSTSNRARAEVGGGNGQPTPRQHSCKHPGPGPDIERGPAPQRCIGHQPDVLRARRRKHPVVRVDPRSQRRHGHALHAQLMTPDHSQQLLQRDHPIARRFAVRLPASSPYVGRPPDVHDVLGVEPDQDRVHGPHLPSPPSAVLTEVGPTRSEAPLDGGDHLPAVVPVALPEELGALVDGSKCTRRGPRVWSQRPR